MAGGNFVAYIRVSTDRQHESGLGEEAQRKVIAEYMQYDNRCLVAEFQEVESGKNSKRPELAAALAACKKHKATLIVAKLDRLSRSVSFLSALQESNVNFKACDHPEASKMFVQLLAVFAEHERDQISARTKAALAVAKERGTKLGNPTLSEVRGKAVDSIKANAAKHAANIIPVIKTIQATGINSLSGIATELTKRGIVTARGGNWSAQTVKNALARIDDQVIA